MPNKSTPKPGRPATFDHLMKRKRAEKTLVFSADDDAKAALEAAEQRLSMARIAGDGVDAAKIAVISAGNALLASDDTVTIRIAAISRGKFERLMREHPPTDEQLSRSAEEKSGRPQYDPEGFYPALLARCAVEPEMDVEQATELLDEWNEGDANEIIADLVRLNSQSSKVDLGS